jgi:glycosyltransferase involved in cell wall biosynthesis
VNSWVPKRIAYVLKIFPKLSETFIISELTELKARDVELLILSLLPPREEPRHQMVAQTGLDRLVSYQTNAFSAMLEKFQPQLVHAHFATESTALARELAWRNGIPFTFTAHGYDIFRKPPADFLDRAKAAAAVITVSRANADYIQKTFGVPSSRLRIIPCGVDTMRFCSSGGTETERHLCPTILCVARLVAVKNLQLLLRACALLCDEDLRFRCILVGDGPYRSELEALRKELGLQKIVEMPGGAAQEKVIHYWQQASVGALTSDNEGMPVCLMEAAACGVPVVATAVGGVPELVEDGITGLLSPAGDAAGFAANVKRLLMDQELRSQMSIAARRLAERNFSVARQVDELLALWSDILERKRPWAFQ